MLTNPYAGMTWENLERGDKFTSSRLGECEFYKYNSKFSRLEVFDKYGVLRYIPVEEYYYDREQGPNYSEAKPAEALQNQPIPVNRERWLGGLHRGRLDY